MKISLAPLEGITGFIVRNAYAHHFDGIDLYYTPFISTGKKLKNKSLRDILPENNSELSLIPQLMSNDADEFIDMEKQLKAFGYEHLNLNLGCPSGTVSSKKRGSGLLLYPEELDHFLEEVFAKTNAKISIKTRIGYASPEEWPAIFEIYQKYPLEELIIHPRVREEFYKGSPHMDSFAHAYQSKTQIPLCYNGDIVSLESYQSMYEQFPLISHTMLGRGLLASPGLAAKIKHSLDTSVPVYTKEEYRTRLRDFHDEIYNGLVATFKSEKDAMLHMKEIWGFLRNSFVDSDKAVKNLLKCQSCMEYKVAVNEIFRCDLIL